MHGPFVLRLPSVEWTQSVDLVALVTALGPDNVRYVGGAVRDTLLGLKVNDIDIATTLHPEEVMSILNSAGIRNIPTGIDHGTITAIFDGDSIEITTLRRDVSCDGRRTTVAFTQNWQEDADRRDFTINALYVDPVTLEVFDWLGALQDLKERRLRFIGDCRERIREDPLRIMRYFRFRARFGSDNVDLESEQACSELAFMLAGLSRERIGSEMLNLLALDDPTPTIMQMQNLGVLLHVFNSGRTHAVAEVNTIALATLVYHEMRQNVSPDPIRRLASLLPADKVIVAIIADNFRLSKMQKRRLVMASERIDGNSCVFSAARVLSYHIGMESAIDRLLLAGADITPLVGWENPSFPLKGGEIVAAGIKAGPEITRILKKIETIWVDEGFPDRARVDQLLSEITGDI